MKKRKRKLRSADVPISLGSLVAILVIAYVLETLLIQQVAGNIFSPEEIGLRRIINGTSVSKRQISTNTTSEGKMNDLQGYVDTVVLKLPSTKPQAIQPPYSSNQLFIPPGIYQNMRRPLPALYKQSCKNDSLHPAIRVYRQILKPVQVPQAEPDFGQSSATRQNFHLFYPIIDPIHRTQFTHQNNITLPNFPSNIVHLKKPVNSQQQLLDTTSETELSAMQDWTNSSRPEVPCQFHNSSYVEYSQESVDDSQKHVQSIPRNSSDSITQEANLLPGKNIPTNSSSSEQLSVEILGQSIRQKNVIESEMVTNKTQVSLVCNAHDMLVRFKFRDPFKGLVISDLSRLRSCHLVGSGANYYEMRIPLNDCGTRQGNPRLFLNSIRIQFRNLLDGEEDEIKTLICSYPIQPAIIVRPTLGSMMKPASVLPERIIEDKGSRSDREPPAALVYYEPLILIASLLLLAITLVGLTTSAYLLMKRRKRAERVTTTPPSFFQQAGIFENLQLARPPLISLSRGDIQMAPSPRLRRGPKHRLRRTPVSYRDGRVSKPSSDSLAPVNENSSVTTIEIPFTPPSLRNEEPQSDDQKIVPANSIPEHVNNDAGKDTSKNLSKEIPSNLHKRANKQVKTGQVNKETQIDSETPTFGSMRASLTSPQEFKRLQEIVRMFDEIHIENRVERGTNKSPLVYNTKRLNPSKYKNRILDIMTKEERELISRLLSEDELFRSQVVECIKLDRFNRKLRNSHLYSHMLSKEAWNLFADILLDTELDKEAENDLRQNLEARLNMNQDESVVGQLDMTENRMLSSNLSSITHKDSLEADNRQTTFNSDSKLTLGKEFRVSMKELIRM